LRLIFSSKMQYEKVRYLSNQKEEEPDRGISTS